MWIAKRILLFVMTNIAVIALISIILIVLQNFLWIEISWYWYNFWSVLLLSAIVGFTWAFFSLIISKFVAKFMYKIRLITAENLNEFNDKERFVYQIVERLASSNNIKMPEVWVYISSEPNAFATWPSKNNSLVAVSTWLLDYMNYDEIEGVIGHEMAHILNWDMVTMTLLQWVINTFVVFLSRIIWTFVDKVVFKNENWPWIWFFVVTIVLQIVLWILASIITSWFSRHREFRADYWSANLVWRDKMIASLKKLQVLVANIETENNPATNSMKIVSKDWLLQLFASHPPLEKRIEALEKNY